MTSDKKPTECFVYITLPGEVNSVTAGRFQLSQENGVPLGRFVYGRKYLERKDCVELDPVELKLQEGTFETTKLKGLFGALRDSGPDYWGRRVIEKYVGVSELSELDYLLQSPEDRAGALGFGLNQTPPAPKRKFNQTLDLEKLQGIAENIVRDGEFSKSETTEQASDLMLIGTSMGGARPKAVVEDQNGLWIAKFNRLDDRWNNARVEYAMLLLARVCGLQVAESKITAIGGRDVLLVKRFDREKINGGYRRHRMISGMTLLQTEDSHLSRDRWSYVLLVEELRRVSGHPKEDAKELFLRMTFNALISNIDDHPRNHALLARDRNWRLSPAYDLTPAAPVSIERRDLALTIGDQGRFANIKNILSQSRRFLLEPEEAKALVLQMEAQVRDCWYTIARTAGVTEAHCKLISGAFCYPGLRA